MDVDESVVAGLDESMAKAPSLKLLVGLGNPGMEYAGTRHNMGFMLVDRLMVDSEKCEACEWQPKEGLLHKCRIGEAELLLLKPMTYMNGSGSAVGETVGKFGISPQELLVVSDDLDMPLGRLRLRMKGSCGGHRGLASIAEYLGSLDFPRLRLGIGRPQSDSESVIDYVLGKWTSDDSALLERVLEAGAEAVRKAANGVLEGCTLKVDEGLSDKDNAEVQGVEN